MTPPDKRPYLERTYQGTLISRGYRRTWAFPESVDEMLRLELAGLSVLHLFGGQAKWGVRLDADPTTRPDVLGNAFFPPFRCGSFDAVVCDPPYKATNGSYRICLVPAACLARSRVWWFSTESIGMALHGLKLLRWWIVIASELGTPRYLAEWERRRHPSSGCWPTKFPSPELRRYDWRSRLEHPNLALGSA